MHQRVGHLSNEGTEDRTKRDSQAVQLLEKNAALGAVQPTIKRKLEVSNVPLNKDTDNIVMPVQLYYVMRLGTVLNYRR